VFSKTRVEKLKQKKFYEKDNLSFLLTNKFNYLNPTIQLKTLTNIYKVKIIHLAHLSFVKNEHAK
jgi:hypothetical protein